VAAKVVVLGIDPGTIATGYGIVSQEERHMKALGWGSVRTSPRSPLSERLQAIHREIARQIETYHPDEVAVEDLFQSKNVRSALKLGHARGVAILAAAEAGLPVFEYAPREVKLSVVGVGGASKEQVASMVGRLLAVSDEDATADATDALAVAICHLHKKSGTLSR
jgi:crossover junction endodeoxyribonuclease RuvC